MSFEKQVKELKKQLHSQGKNFKNLQEKYHLEIKNKDIEIENHKAEIEYQKLVVKSLRHRLFGSPSERFIEENGQASLFNESEEHRTEEDQGEKELISYTRNKPGKKKTQGFPDHLPRERRVIDIPEEDKICPHDGTPLKEIGRETVEKLKTVPAQTTVIVEERIKYACPCCKSHMKEGKSDAILPKTIATPELLSFIITSKFSSGLPLYRIEEHFKHQKIAISREQMSSWLVKLVEELRPLLNILEDWIFETRYVAIDATHAQVLKEKGRRAEAKSFMWVRGSPELGIGIFDYDVSGGGKVADRLMTGYEGALQADAHKRLWETRSKQGGASGLYDACKKKI